MYKCYIFSIFAAELQQYAINPKFIKYMTRNFLPAFVGIAMTKSQFCFATGLTPYKLKQIFKSKSEKYRRLGYNPYDKLLMPSVVRELCNDSGLRIDVDYYTQYIAGQKGQNSPVENVNI